MGIKEDAYRYAIKNAFLHDGKADIGAVVGKIIALHKGEKGFDIKKAMPEIENAVKEVNAMKFEEIEKEYKKFEEIGYELKPKEKESLLPELEWTAQQEVITRFAPNPNGPFHLGNARAAIISHEYARMYNGKFLLRFDDTDPKVKRPIENAEQIFRKDLEWLGCKPDAVFFASDRLDIYYKYMKEALQLGKAYVCTCDVEKWRNHIKKKEACQCRELPQKEQLQRFEKMLRHEFKEGQAVLRIKTDLMHPDPSIRDWWAAKVVDNVEHPNKNALDKHVWPSYNFASAIDDHELGITLILRGQEHAQNKTKQEFLYKYFGWAYPHCFHFGRVKLPGMVLSKSKIEAGIEKGIYSGWDDPRLGTIMALRRRGFDARALKQAILEVGIKSSDTTIEMTKLVDLNKQFIEPESSRIAFFEEPMQLDVQYAKAITVEKNGMQIELHDGVQKFIVSKKQFEEFKVREVVRLRNAYNIRIVRKDPLQIFAEFIGTARIEGKPVVEWLLQGIDAEVVMPDNSKIVGLADEGILNEEKGSIVYFDRFGFCRIDSMQDEKAVLRFTHK